MSSSFGLSDHVKHALREAAMKSLQEVSRIEPPVIYDALYDHEKLKTTLFSKDHPDFQGLVNEIGVDQTDTLRGVLLVKQKHVIVIEHDYDRRNKFTFLHEHGHWKLPWHRALLFKCTQFDLSAAARKQLEIEANFYASEAAFMGDLFMNYLMSSPPSLSHISYLSNVFDMSMESTFRHAVELELRPCAYLVMTVNRNDSDHFLKISYVVHSASFAANVVEFSRKATFPKNHVLAQIVVNPLSTALNVHECIINVKPKGVQLKAEVWKNNWNVFAFCQPLE
jgi:hypothetical protein